MRSLGTAGDKGTEQEVLLLEHDVPHQAFSQAVLSFLPKMPWTITPEVIPNFSDKQRPVFIFEIFICGFIALKFGSTRWSVYILMWMCVAKDMVKREDLRHLTVCSVDPPGCTDIDDALHCRKLDNGNLEVHILYCIHTLQESSDLRMPVLYNVLHLCRLVSTSLMSVISSDPAMLWTKRLQTVAPLSTCVVE